MITDTNIDLLLFFHRLIDSGSIEVTMKEMSVSKSTIYRKIKDLEELLEGYSLIKTHTKAGFILTPIGEEIYREASLLVNEITQRKNNINALSQSKNIKKTIRIVTTNGFISLAVLHIVDEFLKIHTDTNFMINCITEEFSESKFNFDMAFFPEVAINPKKFLLMKMGSTQNCYFASPDYIAKHGKPSNMNELNQHHLLKFHLKTKATRGPTDWVYTDDKIDVIPKITMNSLLGRIYSVSKGLGLANLPKQINSMFNMNWVELDAIEETTSDIFGIISRAKYNQSDLKEFFDFAIEEGSRFLETP